MGPPGAIDIESGVIDALKRVSRRPVDPAPGDDLMVDLGLDSLEVLELVAALEDRFDISVPLDAMPAARTVAQVIAEVTRLVAERASGV